MKLGDLRGAIRKPGNPTMVVDLGNGVPMTIPFQKTPLLEELGKAFNGERTAETGLSYDPVTCTLSVDGFVGAEPTCGTADLQMAEEDEDDPFDTADGSPQHYADGGVHAPEDADEDDDLL